ncbi:MAG: alpha/beta hydrolase [Planctomycetes bacterium]|nr:alpha/beta hydrolase [Planctomycetota bacterium]
MNHTIFNGLLIFLLSLDGPFLNSANAQSAAPSASYRLLRDIQYAEVDKQKLLLDLYLPRDAGHHPLIVWVHGGAWRSGSKKSMPLKSLVEAGYAVASVDYRLSPVAKFPAQVHDCKAAIRFLRSKQQQYGYHAQRIGIAGSSAGGHLAALIGVTNHHEKLEGSVGGYFDQTSTVHAIVDYFGPTNLTTILNQSTPHGLGVRIPALQLLLGGQPENRPEIARLASPVFHVDAKDPPLLMIHGDQDPQVPINQSHELEGAYNKLGAEVQFEVVHGGAHGGKFFFDEQRNRVVKAFFDRNLRTKNK